MGLGWFFLTHATASTADTHAWRVVCLDWQCEERCTGKRGGLSPDMFHLCCGGFYPSKKPPRAESIVMSLAASVCRYQ